MTDLYYQISGKGKPILFIHGGGTDLRMWEGIAKKLSKEYKLIMYDLRGHGKSPVPTGTTNHIKDLGVLFSTLNLEKAILIGHSLGAQIATDFTILNPQKVSNLVCISPGLTGFEYDSAYQAMSQQIWDVVPNVNAMLNIMLYTPEAYAMQKTMKSPSAPLVEGIHRENIEKSLTWKSFKQEWPIPNTTDRLSEVNIPILFIVGSDDKSDIFKIKELYRKAPKVNFEELSGADHGIIVTHPSEVSEIILEFLKE